MSSSDTSFTFGPTHATRACLLIHGFNGSPPEMLPLGEALAREGFFVLGISLAGHNGDPEALLRSNRAQWYASAEKGLAKLATFPHVFVAGLSMGGVLALRLALAHGSRIAGVITMSTPTRFTGGWYIHALPVARHFVKWFYPLEYMDFADPQMQNVMLQQARLRDPEVSIDFSQPEVVAGLKQLVRVPVSAIAELFALTNHCRHQLHRLQTPLLIVHSHLDQVVHPTCADELFALTRSAFPKYLYWLDKSEHVLTTGPELPLLTKHILDFTNMITPTSLVPSPPAPVLPHSSGETRLPD